LLDDSQNWHVKQKKVLNANDSIPYDYSSNPHIRNHSFNARSPMLTQHQASNLSKPATTNPDQEDEDLNRAIADSLMTASFHSARTMDIDENKPEIKPRTDGA
jgi:hypothetical protein